MGAFLRVKNLTFRYFMEGKRNVLDHASLEIEEGGITLLTGDSGCGKSTLAAVIAGLYPENGGFLEGGEAELCGVPVSSLNPRRRAEYLTMMFQNPDLQFCMDTLRREMRFCMENIRVSPGEMDARAEQAALETGTAPFLDRPLHSLSGGEKQRAALACLFVMESRGILLDEPFANLDRAAAASLVQLLVRIRRSGRTIIAIEHQLDRWLGEDGNLAADEVIFLGRGGKVLERKRAKEVSPSLFRGRLRPRGPGAAESVHPAVQFEHLSIPPLFEDVSASFPAGCMTAVLGASGSGKTTMFLAALGQRPYGGTIRIEGLDIRHLRKKAIYQRAGIVFQNPSSQFVTQNVADEVAQSLRVWEKGLAETERRARTEQWLEAFGLLEYRHFSPYMLSQGQQRKLAVLAVLAGGQKILFLDEPTYGQDRASVLSIMELLRRRSAQEGLTVIFITHDDALAEAWADKIYRLENKKMIEEVIR